MIWKGIEALLADAEEKQIQEKSVRLWLHDLKELANKIKDLRDVCEYEVVARKVKSSKDPSSLSDVEACPCTTRFLSPLVDASFKEQVAGDLRTIKREFDAIAKRREALQHLEEVDGRKHSFINDGFTGREPTGHLPTDPVFLGREREMEELRGMLLADHGENVEVIAVTGMGGAGKTTLAQHACKDAQIKSQFEKTGWVHVSNSFDVIRLTKGIIEAFSGNSNPNQLSPLQDEVNRLTKNRKVLLVMDDVWNTESWESVVAPLNHEARKGSKILVTTRLPEVAAGVRATRSITLKSLSEDDGWSLLREHAFLNRSDDVDNLEELEEIGKRIVQKCGGLPLSIKLLGRLLCSKGNDEEKWREVSESNLLDFQEVREAKLIIGSLYLSYLYLSPELKACFKLSAIYQNKPIISTRLRHLWISYDLVKDWKEANEYLGELTSRSFLEFQPDTLDEEIRMHDHIYDLAQFLVGETHRNLIYESTISKQLTELDFSCSQRASLDRCGFFPVDDNNRRPWMRKPVYRCFKKTSPNLRTLQLPVNKHTSPEKCLRELDDGMIRHMQFTSDDERQSCLKCLRIFIFSKGLSYIPHWAFHLYNLRYLELSGSGIGYLPDDVCDLLKLRCLNLGCSRISYLPASISRLVKLDELNLHGCYDIKELPESIISLTNLSILNLEDSEISCLPESISRLVNLHELNLDGCYHIKELPKSIISLTNLSILNLERTRLSFMPKGFGALTKLQHLTDFIIDSTQAGIAELKNMKRLEGAIVIDNLCEVVSKEDAAQAEIASKKRLRHILFRWRKNANMRGSSPFKLGAYCVYDLHDAQLAEPWVDGKFLLEKGNEEKIARHEKLVFEQLGPHRNIEEVFIIDYRGFKLPSWMGDAYFTKLKAIQLYGIRYCKSLSPIEQLPSLAILILRCMDSLEELVPNPCIEPVDVMDQATKKRLSFPKLESLDIRDCESLQSLPLYKFASLVVVEVIECLNLEKMEPPYDIPCPLKYISISRCPKFHFSPDPRFPQPPWEVHINLYGTVPEPSLEPSSEDPESSSKED